jgi:hypothetical protein
LRLRISQRKSLTALANERQQSLSGAIVGGIGAVLAIENSRSTVLADDDFADRQHFVLSTSIARTNRPRAFPGTRDLAAFMKARLKTALGYLAPRKNEKENEIESCDKT